MLLLTLSYAHAFCGTYVGPVDTDLVNRASQVILAHNGDDTVLTLAADLTADVPSFGLVVPVPEVLTEDDVTLGDTAVFATLQGWSAPRLVSYTCQDLHPSESDADSDADTTGNTETADGVIVEAEFTVGAYDVAVLTATGAEGLVAWLDAHGFVLTEAAAPVIQEYIDAGQHFVAARVDLEEAPTDGGWLEPLRLHYADPAFVLPIRIGTTAAEDEQDVILYVLDDERVGIANYPEAQVESDCMLPPDLTDVAAFWEGQLTNAFADGNWLVEYAWNAAWCDPCSTEPPDEATLATAGWTGSDTPVVTRLHLRYSPEEATQDVVLYGTGNDYAFTQVKYILYRHELESDFPICGIGTPEDPGECPDGGTTDGEDDTGDGGGDDTGGGADTDDGGDTDDGDDGGCSGCATGSSAAGLAGLVAGLALVTRRRR